MMESEKLHVRITTPVVQGGEHVKGVLRVESSSDRKEHQLSVCLGYRAYSKKKAAHHHLPPQIVHEGPSEAGAEYTFTLPRVK